MRIQFALCSVALSMACGASSALADITVTNLSPAWLQVGDSAAWVPVGLFQFNQA